MEEKKYYSRKICIVALILGIFALILCWVPILGLIIGIIELIISLIANVKRIKYKEKLMWCTIFGFIASIIGIIVGATVFFVIFFNAIFDLNLFKEIPVDPSYSMLHMSRGDVEMYNATVMNYATKETLSGMDIKLMIEDIITQNSQYVDESKKFIGIHAKNISDYHNEDYLDELVKNASDLESENGNNNWNNINAAKDEYRNLAKSIKKSKEYKITTTDYYGLIYAVLIEEL